MLRGYTPAAWDETLDVAGYPRESQLPASYRGPAAMPLIERRVEAPKPPPVPTTPPAAEPSNPSGIRF
jgi:hypothetical protein